MFEIWNLEKNVVLPNFDPKRKEKAKTNQKRTKNNQNKGTSLPSSHLLFLFFIWIH